MVVALCALHVAAEEDPADVAGNPIRIGLAREIEIGGRSGLRVAIGSEYFGGELMEGAIAPHGVEEVGLPFFGWDVRRRSPFHQHQVQHARQVTGVARIVEELINSGRAFFWIGIPEEGPHLVRGGGHADKVQRDPSQEFGVAAK
jgi:hypothetical protein